MKSWKVCCLSVRWWPCVEFDRFATLTGLLCAALLSGSAHAQISGSDGSFGAITLAPDATATIALPLFVLLASACRWAVPADPGLNAKLRQKPRTFVQTQSGDSDVAQDEDARILYMEKCGRCHAPYAPSYLSASRWPSMMRKYAPRAGLYGADRERVQSWLLANARR